MTRGRTAATRTVPGRPARTSTTRGRLARIIGYPVALILAGLLVLPWLDALVGNVIPVLQALTLVWIVAAVIAFLVALLTRRRWAIIAFTPALLLAIGASWLLTTSGHTPPAAASRGQHRMTVLSLNAELGAADAPSAMKLIRDKKPDVVVLVEMTKTKLDALDHLGLRSITPHRTGGMIDDGARGSVVLSRWPVTTLDADSSLGPYDLQSPTARVAAPGASVVVRAVHTYPPLPNGVAQWRPQLRDLERWQREQPDSHLIMAGDYNAAVTHPAFRDLRDGLTDAVAQQQTAAWPTWPHGSWLPPFVQIDHILTRGFVPQGAGIDAVDGTDHAAVWTTLRY